MMRPDPLQTRAGQQIPFALGIVASKPSGEDASLSRPVTTMSFFCGCGGLDLGFMGNFRSLGEYYPWLPFEILRAYDSCPRCLETYAMNLGGHSELKDLGAFDAAEMPAADLLIGGFPCQDFSSCGPKNGLSSDRGKLYRALVHYMDVHRPAVVVAENVPHLARMHKGTVLQTILGDLSRAGPGYEFQVWRLYAPDYGVPQRRTRLFIVGVRADLRGKPESPVPVLGRGAYRSIDWAIEDLAGVVDESVPNQSQYFLASKAKNGNGQGDEVNRAGEPSYTIRANAKSRVQFHYRLPRRLTVRECARLQTFPDTFQFPHSATENIFQIGNAVPPMLAHFVARSVVAFFAAQPGYNRQES